MKLLTVKKQITKDDVGKYALLPCTRLDVDEFQKLKFGRAYAEVANFRTPIMEKLFNKWWSICQLIADRFDEYKTKDEVSDYLLMKIGEVDFYETQIVNGQPITRVKVKSISWPKMDVNKFEEVFTKAEPIMCEMLECTAEDLRDNLIFD